jgi:hypothetical protein
VVAVYVPLTELCRRQMGINWIVPALTRVATALVMSALLAGARRRVPPSPDGSLRLTYGPGVALFGVVLLVLVLLLAIFAVVSPPREQGDVVALIGLVAGFGLPGAYLVLEGRRTCFDVTADGIVAASPWRRPLALAWQDVAKVHFSRALGYLVLTGRDAKKVSVSLFITGFDPLLEVVVERLGHAMAGQAAVEARDYVRRIRGESAGGPTRITANSTES